LIVFISVIKDSNSCLAVEKFFKGKFCFRNKYGGSRIVVSTEDCGKLMQTSSNGRSILPYRPSILNGDKKMKTNVIEAKVQKSTDCIHTKDLFDY